MRKVIGIGETILDILFKEDQPKAAVPGGSVFNGIISLGRAGVPVTFISETGDDHVGKIILDFMQQNGVSTDCVSVFPARKSPVSLAFLNEQNDAEYVFYKDYQDLRIEAELPEITSDDIVMIGSYYAVNPQLREKVKDLLDLAHEKGAIIYYDVNFRSTHKDEAIKLMPTILENFEYADIIRGSAEDFFHMFQLADPLRIYQSKVLFYGKPFICTQGGEAVSLHTKGFTKDYPVAAIPTVSTIGAGDNFNAGLVYGLLKHRIRRSDLVDLTAADWDELIGSGVSFSAHVCQSLDNYISREFAEALK